MAFKRDDESFDSGAGPDRSTGANSVSSRQDPASNTSSTNVSLRRAQQTLANRQNTQNLDPDSLEGQAGILLEDRLREVREEKRRDSDHELKQNEKPGARSRQRRIIEESRGGARSSPKTPAAYIRGDIAPSTSSSMGARAQSDEIGKLRGEVYDLKLKTFHLEEKAWKTAEALDVVTEQRDAALEDKDHAFSERDKARREIDEVKSMNAKLLCDIKTRDEAIYQAACKISKLELELDALYEANESTLKPSGQLPAVDKSPNVPDNSSLRAMKSSPPQKTTYSKSANSAGSSSTPVQQLYQAAHNGDGSLVRMPSFLSDMDPETSVLRAMFMPRSQSMNSMATVDENDDGYGPFGERALNSPHLSLISESSLLSVYPRKQFDDLYDNGYSDDGLNGGMKRQLTKPNIKEWAGGIENVGGFENFGARDRKQREPTSEPHSHTQAERSFVSITDVAEDPPLSQRELLRRMAKKNVPAIVNRQRQRFSEARMSDSSPSFQAQVRNFKKQDHDIEPVGNGRILPPTPDTFSTNTLQHQVNPSNDTLNSTLDSNTYRTVRKAPSFDDSKDKGRSRMSGALFEPNPDPEFVNGRRIRRPRSYTETVTSRREGHGWDTATPSEQTVTETNSDFSSEATSKDVYATLRPAPNYSAFNPPDILKFTSERPFNPSKGDWDITRDIKTPAKYRTGTAMGYRSDRDFDRTPTKGAYRERSHSMLSAETRRQSVGPDTISSAFQTFQTPPRRSSLHGSPISNEKRARRLKDAQDSARVESTKSPSPLKPKPIITAEPLLNTSQLNSVSQTEPKKGLGLFQRVGFGLRNVSITNPVSFNRAAASKEKENKQLEEERATPPPILRRSRNEQARRDAAERHLRPHGSSTQGSSPATMKTEIERPQTSHGDGRASSRVVTFGEAEKNRLSQPSRSADSQQDEAEEMDAQKAADTGSNKGMKKWGFSLGNRTLRRAK